jgi:hypothetical protein
MLVVSPCWGSFSQWVDTGTTCEQGARTVSGACTMPARVMACLPSSGFSGVSLSCRCAGLDSPRPLRVVVTVVVALTVGAAAYRPGLISAVLLPLRRSGSAARFAWGPPYSLSRSPGVLVLPFAVASLAVRSVTFASQCGATTDCVASLPWTGCSGFGCYVRVTGCLLTAPARFSVSLVSGESRSTPWECADDLRTRHLTRAPPACPFALPISTGPSRVLPCSAALTAYVRCFAVSRGPFRFLRWVSSARPFAGAPKYCARSLPTTAPLCGNDLRGCQVLRLGHPPLFGCVHFDTLARKARRGTGLAGGLERPAFGASGAAHWAR